MNKSISNELHVWTIPVFRTQRGGEVCGEITLTLRGVDVLHEMGQSREEVVQNTVALMLSDRFRVGKPHLEEQVLVNKESVRREEREYRGFESRLKAIRLKKEASLYASTSSSPTPVSLGKMG